MFSGILNQSATLSPGTTYVITMDTNEWLFRLHMPSWLRDKFNSILYLITIISLDSSTMSDRFSLRFTPKSRISYMNLVSQMTSILRGTFPQISFIQIETGTTSTDSGGLPSLLPDTGTVIGETVGAAVKPLIPIIALSVLGLYFISKTNIKNIKELI